jgi:hypothetical protein
MMTRNIFALGALLFVPAFTAGAQFTTVVAPPPAQKQAVAEAAAKAEVPRDTGRRATLQAMSAWVDSVAGVPAQTATVTDSVGGDVVAATDSTPAAAEAAGAGTTKFSDGARAPNTASPLPFLLVAGLGALLVGGWLLVTGRQEVPVPVVPPRRAS